MDAWDRVLSIGKTAWHAVVHLHGLLQGAGVAGCVLAVAAGLQMARWGLRLTADDWKPAPPARRARALGPLLQACGAAVCAIAMVALVRQLVR